MPKNIVVCLDGTWNGVDVDSDKDGVPEDTNVLRMFRSLAGATAPETRDLVDEEEREERDAAGNRIQVAKYLHGVGDSSSPIVKMMGGAFGAGIVKRVVRGYTYACRHYEPGDRIYLAGFSRGAYTARALAGMIAKAGLMDYAKLGHPDKDQAYRYGFYVWAYYREKQGRGSPVSVEATRVWRKVFLAGDEVGEEQMIPAVDVEAVAVFDTVGALGIPRYDGKDRRIDLFEFADCDLSPRVRNGVHALAIDEYRRDFGPTLWNERDAIEQAWFIGAHADVGGGYEQTELSNLGLGWLMDRLANLGVRFSSPAQPGDSRGEIHDSWDSPLYNLHPRVPRAVPVRAKLHESVRDRRNDPNAAPSPGSPAPYAPPGLAGWKGSYVR
jgi:glutathione S-transferase